MIRFRIILSLLCLSMLFGCSKKAQDFGPVEQNWGRMVTLVDIVGNMNNKSYSQGRTQNPRISASGKNVHMTDFDGDFVWSEYAALWCPTCAQQSPQTKKVEKALGDEMWFLTVMTAEGTEYNSHATQKTAKKWASKNGLNPDMVIAAELWSKTIPEHRLFSPEGHTLFVHVGYLDSEQIKEVIAFYRNGWEKWKQSGESAEWMING